VRLSSIPSSLAFGRPAHPQPGVPSPAHSPVWCRALFQQNTLSTMPAPNACCRYADYVAPRVTPRGIPAFPPTCSNHIQSAMVVNGTTQQYIKVINRRYHGRKPPCGMVQQKVNSKLQRRSRVGRCGTTAYNATRTMAKTEEKGSATVERIRTDNQQSFVTEARRMLYRIGG